MDRKNRASMAFTVREHRCHQAYRRLVWIGPLVIIALTGFFYPRRFYSDSWYAQTSAPLPHAYFTSLTFHNTYQQKEEKRAMRVEGVAEKALFSEQDGVVASAVQARMHVEGKNWYIHGDTFVSKGDCVHVKGRVRMILDHGQLQLQGDTLLWNKKQPDRYTLTGNVRVEDAQMQTLKARSLRGSLRNGRYQLSQAVLFKP